MDYLYAHDGRAEYRLTPVMREDAWERFEELPLRKLTVGIAGHPDVAGLEEGDERAVWAAVNDMKEAYEAHTVKIELSMGQRRGALSRAAKRFARDAFARHANGEDDIRMLRGVLDTGEGHENDEVDLLGTLFTVKEDLHFPEDNFAQFYRLRRDLLRSRIRRVRG